MPTPKLKSIEEADALRIEIIEEQLDELQQQQLSETTLSEFERDIDYRGAK